MDRLYDALDAFSSCTGIPVTVYDTENRITREFNAEQKVCRLFPHFSQSEGCQGYLTFSMDESFALGEPYIFFCPAGFVEIAVPILYNGARRGCVLAGPLVLGSVDEKLLARMREVLESTDIDETRIVTEAAIYADKTAVDEETVRLRSHLHQLDGMLNEVKPVGRKLDFLVQEMNREANTIGSKANDVEMAQTVVNIKSEIEKIREQIKNIE